MDKKIKARWVKALRSRKYKQGKEQLRVSEKRYCCLGVLCVIYAKDHGVSYEEAVGDENEMLPIHIKTWAGVPAADGGRVKIGDEEASLADHNDRGRRFSTIAKAIEEQL